jgi:integrase
MSIYKRKGSQNWWIELTDAEGKCIQFSSGTEQKELAQELHDRCKHQIWEERRLGVKPRMTWNDAVVKYISEKAGKKTLNTDKLHLRWVDKFLSGKYLDEINRDLINEIAMARSAPYEDSRKVLFTPKASTVNRTLEIIRAILRMARDDWGWISSCPKIAMKNEGERRVLWLTRDQAERLISFLPPYLQVMMRFTLETGLRRRNVTHLEWSQIDLEKRHAWIHPDQAKAGKSIAVPLSDEAVRILSKQVGQHDLWVFPLNGKPIIQTANRAWRKALKEAGTPEGVNWHTLRHTWASWHAQNGTPLHVLQALGGWASAEMVQRYAHLSTNHLAEYVDKHVGLRQNDSNYLEAA